MNRLINGLSAATVKWVQHGDNNRISELGINMNKTALPGQIPDANVTWEVRIAVSRFTEKPGETKIAQLGAPTFNTLSISKHL